MFWRKAYVHELPEIQEDLRVLWTSEWPVGQEWSEQ